MKIADSRSDHVVAELYGIDRKSLRDWRKIRDERSEILDKKRKRIKGDGNRSITYEYETMLLAWIYALRDEESSFKIQT